MVSMEIRELIIANREDGMKVPELSRVFRVGESTIWRLLEQKRETGNIKPQYKGKQSSLTAEQTEEMLKYVEEHPDATLKEIGEALNLPIKKSQISKLLHEAGYRVKKR